MKYADKTDGLFYVGKFRSIIYFMRSKHVFYTTGQIPIKPSSKQIVIHLDHGTTNIKACNLLSNINNGDDFFFTYYTVPSEIYIPVVKKEFLCGNENISINGEPVMDILYSDNIEKVYEFGKYEKIGLWTPTFRQSDYLGYEDSSEELLPMFPENDYRKLNSHLAKFNIKLIVKLHAGQNVKNLKQTKFSHLEILSDREFESRGFELYTLMKQIDFLLADYSSVYLEFLVLDKPIGFIIPDIDEYKEKRGFIFENIETYMPGEKIKMQKQLYDYIEKISMNIDEYVSERKTVKNIIHKYQDGKNCERVIALSEIKR